ncbi:MAG: hypothetical protein ACRDK4_12040 [Solirubrobacteraceae bacterium]
MSVLESELGAALTIVAEPPTLEADAALARKLSGLRWSDRRITAVVRYAARTIGQRAHIVQLPVCADMRAWVASGYKILAPASKALAERDQTEVARLLLLSVPELLLSRMKRFNGPVENALEHRLKALRERVSEARSSERGMYDRALTAIGLPSRESATKTSSRKRKPPIEFGQGRTASGNRYSVWLLAHDGIRKCETGVEVRQGEKVNASDCIPGFGKPQPTVKCIEGLLTVEIVTTGAARTVELRLSDGSRIASRPIRIPMRLGGHGGVYYQQIRGPAPVPVALVELSARGRRLKTFKLERFMGCTKHPFTYLPGGFKVLARGSEPRGPQFAIVAERYRFYGVVHFKLRFVEGAQASELRRVHESDGLFEQVIETGGEEEPGEVVRSGRFVRPVFLTNVESGCHPYEHSLVYGLLKSRRDRVFVKFSGQLRQLRPVSIPVDMRAGAGAGAVAYGAFSSPPETVIVRGPEGRVLMREDRRREADEEREKCEGEAEGAGPTVGEDGDTLFFASALFL